MKIILLGIFFSFWLFTLSVTLGQFLFIAILTIAQYKNRWVQWLIKLWLYTYYMSDKARMRAQSIA